MSSEIKKNLPILSLRVVMALTSLSARQIRYYEEKKLISFYRSKGNQRFFSLNDLDELMIIKELLDSGETIADIHSFLDRKTLKYKNSVFKNVSDEEARDIFRDEMIRNLDLRKNNFE